MPLQLRPNCEYCDKDLPPSSTDARICSYECTYCSDCAESVIFNVCPNCGGGLEKRPIRPSKEWRSGVFLGKQPASTDRVNLKHPKDEVKSFVERVKGTDAAER